MNPKIRTAGFSVILMLLSQFTLAEDYEDIVRTGKQEVLLSQEFTFYGLDFSFLKLVNAEKMTEGESIKNTYCPAWIGEFDKEYTQKKVEGLLNIEVVYDKRYPFQSDQYVKNDANTIVSMYSVTMSTDALEAIVKDYSLEESSGIGLSMIVAELNKPDEDAISYITFFDISSRELLYVVEIKGSGSGMGMTKHWYYGIDNSFYDYFQNRFRFDQRKAIKEAKKASK